MVPKLAVHTPREVDYCVGHMSLRGSPLLIATVSLHSTRSVISRLEHAAVPAPAVAGCRANARCVRRGPWPVRCRRLPLHAQVFPAGLGAELRDEKRSCRQSPAVCQGSHRRPGSQAARRGRRRAYGRSPRRDQLGRPSGSDS